MICIADYMKLKDSIRKTMDGSSCEKLHILVVTELSPDWDNPDDNSKVIFSDLTKLLQSKKKKKKEFP